ncbi:MAG TPA: cytochrome c oxidase assembly protein [Asticcacaulis sp.]|nr:cytochrome c oxidase assembly protein [Asticcacaulis sp.]
MNKNTRVVLSLVGALVVMGGLAYASVPLYRAFCSATGFNGTARKAAAAPTVAVNRFMRVRFDANARDIPWAFKPDAPYLDTQVGRTKMINFTVTNTAKVPITGRASYNILPDTMGPYFMKLQCFCFQNQTLQPGESKQFPVVYYLDPKLITDPDTKTLPEVTLSYTFFEAKDDTAEAKK